jgi:hypothetical protein
LKLVRRHLIVCLEGLLLDLFLFFRMNLGVTSEPHMRPSRELSGSQGFR